MHILDVAFEAISRQNSRCEAVVMLKSDQGTTLFFCTIDLDAAACQQTAQHALLGDALRQMARMPEYRRGRANISLAPHLQHAAALAKAA